MAKGRAEVQTTRVAHGGQAVRTGDCVIEMTLKNPAKILWADAFIQDPGISQARKIPDGKASSVLLFHDGKLLALDGDGNGSGKFVTAAELPGDRFTRLTIRTDYEAKRFDVWVDGKPALAKLGFKDNSVTQFHGAKRLAGANSYLDDFSLSTWGLDRDSDGDSLNDLDEAKFYGSYPLLADSDRDGASDSQEFAAGTHRADPSSIFAVKIDSTASDQTKLSIPTVTGLEYTLQRRPRLARDSGRPCRVLKTCRATAACSRSSRPRRAQLLLPRRHCQPPQPREPLMEMNRPNCRSVTHFETHLAVVHFCGNWPRTRDSVLECGSPCRFRARSKAVRSTALQDAPATALGLATHCLLGFTAVQLRFRSPQSPRMSGFCLRRISMSPR